MLFRRISDLGKKSKKLKSFERLGHGKTVQIEEQLQEIDPRIIGENKSTRADRPSFILEQYLGK